MKQKMARLVLKRIIQYTLLALVAIIMFFPIYWVISSSFKTVIGISHFPPEFFPKNPQFSNYLQVFLKAPILIYARNTLLLMIGTTTGTLISSAIVAYPLARMNFKGKNVIFAIILATMMVPSTTTLIPQYMLFSKIGWIDSMLPMIVPAFFAYPYNVFLLRQFYRGIPKSLDEAAAIDGCSRLGILIRIIIPLSKPAFITIGVLSCVFWWNELLTPLIYIDSNNLKPLTTGALATFQQGFIINWNYTMAMCVIMIIPPIIGFLFANKYLIAGIKTTGMKG